MFLFHFELHRRTRVFLIQTYCDIELLSLKLAVLLAGCSGVHLLSSYLEAKLTNGLSSGPLAASCLCRSGVHTKLSVNMVIVKEFAMYRVR